MNTFDLILFVVTLGAGIFSIIMPEKAYSILQTKKYREEYTDKIKKTMIISGIVLIVLALAFGAITFL